ncbi:VOC family protein [Nonomuraea sp. NBC_01738]|uniref:VOC family protein n=1 Tax=Nonomuraea sp. NBC_01738 TaxID=2976003 RepID=UPI002E0DED18
MATVSYWADDVTEAARWYADLLGTEPYFVRPEQGPPAYVEFRIGDYQAELGIINRAYAPPGASTEPGGSVLYWQVDDLQATLDKLLAMGAKPWEPVTPRGDTGFVTASVLDPFGNVLGLMVNPHYLEILGRS